MKLLQSFALKGTLFSSIIFGLAACSEGNVGNDGDENTVRAEAAFNLKTGISPLPIDLFFSGSTDGTLNIPNTSGNPAITAVNQLDGWSTTANISVPFTADIDPATLNPQTVLLFKVTTAEVAPGGVALIPPPNPAAPTSPGMTPQPLEYGVDYFAEVSPAEADGTAATTMLIHPLKPLDPKSGYLVVLVSNVPTPAGPIGIATPEGMQMQSSGAFQLLKDFVTPGANEADRFYRLEGDPDHTGNPNNDLTQLAHDNNLTAIDAPTLENLRRLYEGTFGVTDTFLPRSAVLFAWTISTQSTTDVMTTVEGLANDFSKFAFVQPVPNGFGGIFNTSNIPDANLPGIADVYAGILNLPYYLEKADSQNDPTPLTSFWVADPAQQNVAADPAGCFYALTGQPKGASNALTRCNTTPVERSVETVPMLVTVPNNRPEPMGGWPVVIFQHGITRNRSDVFAVADTLASFGFVAIAIDQPLHGITDTNSMLYSGAERTFDLDLVTVTLTSDGPVTSPGPDGLVDPSGVHYVQLASTLTSRDNLRQSAADIIQLAKTIVAGIDLDPNDGDGNDLDTGKVHFLGHSLGGIVGTTAAGINSDFNAVNLAMSGGGIGKLLDGSGSFSDTVATGLAAQGVIEGTETYESFLRLAQTAVDAGDAINFAALANDQHPVLLFEVIDDETVPNNVVDNPLAIVDGWLSGTDPIARTMELPVITTDTTVAGGADGFRVFTEGDHGSILDPSASPVTTGRMQCEAATFFAEDGEEIAADSCIPAIP